MGYQRRVHGDSPSEELSPNMKLLLLCVFLGCATGLAIEPLRRSTLDEEELMHAVEARNEAIQLEMEDAEERFMEAVEEEEIQSRNIVEPAPEERRIGAGLGIQFLGLGAGASAGIGNGGIGFNGNAGFGHNFVNYGTPAHFSQYYARPAYAYGAYPPAVQSRRIGLGAGVNLGPLGAGASAGIGQGQIGFSGGLGFGGNYANYGTRPHYSQYYVNPNRQPWFNPNQLYY